MQRVAAFAFAVTVALSACAGRGAQPPPPSQPPAMSDGVGARDHPPATADAVAWRHLATVEGTLRHNAAAAAVQDAPTLDEAWTRYGFDGAPPRVDFDHRFVLLVLQPDDACPDELIALEVVDGALRVEWLSPPGGCNQPLIFRVHAVQVHRGHVPSTFTAALEEPYATEAESTQISLAPYDGPPAPPPPQPPRAMTDDELDAVFADHPVRRCTPDDDVVPPLRPGTVIDERDLAAEEALMQLVIAWLRDEGWDLHREVVPIMDRHDDLRPHLRVDADRAPALQRQVDREFGEGMVVVDANGYRMADIAAAQKALTPLMGGTGPGSIMSSSGLPGPVRLGMVDPTREALDEIAATVDPALVCIDVERSGVGEREG